jgi:tetratricopeptide (TPR) repeat protein
MPPRPNQPQATPVSNPHRTLLAILIPAGLVVLTFLVFSPIVHNDFVNYDDPDYVTSNPHVQGGFTWPNIMWAFSTGQGHASNWHPVTWLSHMLDYQLFQGNAAAHHLMNVGLHAANVALLFVLLWWMTDCLWRSAFVAAVFAWHPLHVESVAWVSERKDVLSAFFFFLTLLAYVSCVKEKQKLEQGKFGTRKGSEIASGNSYLWSVVFYVLSLFLYALGLMSKPMLVTTPFIMLLLDWWPLRRTAGCGMRNAERSSPEPKATDGAIQSSRLLWLVLEKIPFFALSLGSSQLTLHAQKEGGAVSTSISLGARLLNALVAYALYIRNMFIPKDLAVLYPHPGHWPVGYVIAAAAILIVICVVVAVFGLKRPWLFVGWLWYLGMLVPAIGVVQVGIQCMADRYTYLPLIGLFVMIIWTVGELLEKSSASSDESRGFLAAGVAGGAGIILCACIASTIHQIGYWRDSETLFEHTAQVTRNNYLAYNNLGYYLSNRGKTQEAMENYRKALEINPQYEDAYNNMGYALAALKRYPEAIAHYRAALKFKPNHTEVHNNLGNALADLGQVDEAVEEYKIVLKENPEHADAHNNLGIALAMKGQFDQATAHFAAAIKYKKNYASAHSNLGNALAVQHKLPEAIREYQECLRLNPNDAQAHNNIGNALAELGNMNEAIQHYQRALELNKDNPEAHFNLGIALKRIGTTNEAINHFKEALRLKPDYVEAQKELGGN